MELKDAMECACAYLSYRDRSRSELKRYLAKKGCQEEQILQVLEKLEEYGYVDDRRLARSVISSQLETKAAGKRAAGQKLQRLGIEREIARQALGEIDPDKERGKRFDVGGKALAPAGGGSVRPQSQAAAPAGFQRV